jgi:hypothetical protein
MKVIARTQSVRSNPAATVLEPAGLLRRLCCLAMPSVLLGACHSPEAGRSPGQPGADIRNWGRPIEMHAGAEPYHDTPCVEQTECTGPSAVFGRTPPPE